MPNDIKDTILSTIEASLDAQLRAVRRLRKGEKPEVKQSRKSRLSQVDMAYDVLKKLRRAPPYFGFARSNTLRVWNSRRSRQFGLLSRQEDFAWRSFRAHRAKHFRIAQGGKMTLLGAFLETVQAWADVFPQKRSFERALRQALGGLVCLGRRTISRIIWTNGRQKLSWASEYFLHSRCQWDPQKLFSPILKRALPSCSGNYIGVAVDDTRLHKTGRMIQQAFFQRDPLSPPFHINLMLGLRFLQASLLVPLYKRSDVGTRALPIRFQEASRVKKPGRKASVRGMETVSHRRSPA